MWSRGDNTLLRNASRGRVKKIFYVYISLVLFASAAHLIASATIPGKVQSVLLSLLAATSRPSIFRFVFSARASFILLSRFLLHKIMKLKILIYKNNISS